MSLSPEYSVDIIVLVRYKNKYTWYLQEKEYWVLDYNKWASVFDSLGHDDTAYGDDLRDDFPILDSDNWSSYEKVIKDHVVTKEQLSEMIRESLPIESWDEKGELFPSLFVDFDKKELFSLFPEPLSFEDFVPDNWVGKYDNFYELIPATEKYWIIDGADHLPAA
ncbi:hypothetical protein [Longitalea luteola]|uniref:hypothetical protein n=1 Tax=Longitalea luteola TaxID=2812563 RepID=UPI001A96BECF|nr:hypothetical protein [Longitalea luteola]